MIIKCISTCVAVALVLSTIPAQPVMATGISAAGEKIANQTRWAPEKFRKYGITYREFCIKNGEPAPGHILIGTYLVNLVPEDPGVDAQGNRKDPEPAITGATYQAAMISRKTYAQDVSFYKSELAGGEWRDIDIATSMADILPNGGVRVSEEEMDEMLITVYVSGGKEKPTTDDDDSEVNPFLNPSPYNLDEMDAMKGLLAMTTDGSLKYKSGSLDKDEVAENQSKRFMYDRLIFMFGHDEVTDTLPMKDTDGANSLQINKALTTTAGSRDNKLIEGHNDYVEHRGELDLSLAAKAVDGDYYTDGEDGSIASSARLLYHFSDTRDEVTKPLDKAVVNLWEIYKEYNKASDVGVSGVKNEDKAKFIYDLCSSCDTERRAEAYFNLSLNPDFHGGTGPVLDSVLEMSQKGTSNVGRNIANMDYYKQVTEGSVLTGGSKDAGFVEDTTLSDAIRKAKKDASDMYSDYSAYALTRGVTALSILIYEDKMALINTEKKDDRTDKIITEGILAQAIRDDSAKDEVKEAELLTTVLIPGQNTILSQYLQQGLPAKYNDVGMTSTQKAALLASQQSTAYNSEEAMEKLITSYLSRETSESVYAGLLNSQLTWVRGQKSVIKNTDYAKHAEEVRKKYEDFLKKTMESLGLDTGELDGDPILKELEDKKNQAIENNDPKGAKELDYLIDKYKKEKPDTPDGFIPKITIDPETNMPTISYEPKGETTDNTSSMYNGTGKDGKDGDGSEGINGDDGLNGKGVYDLTTTDGLLSALEAALGKSFSELGPDGKVAMIAALNQYGRENGINVCLELARKLMDQIVGENNFFVYTKFAGSADMEYVSMAAIDRARLYTRYRTVQEGFDITMTRTDVGLSYTYRYGSPTATDMNLDEKDLAARLASRTDPYIGRGNTDRYPYLDEVDSQMHLECRAEYIIDNPYALVITSNMEVQVKQILGILDDLYKK